MSSQPQMTVSGWTPTTSSTSLQESLTWHLKKHPDAKDPQSFESAPKRKALSPDPWKRLPNQHCPHPSIPRAEYLDLRQELPHPQRRLEGLRPEWAWPENP